VFAPRDRARLILILRGKRLGFSLSDIREYLDLYDTDITRRTQTRMLLRRVTERLARLEAQRKALDETVAELREIAKQAEATLHGAEARPRRAAR